MKIYKIKCIIVLLFLFQIVGKTQNTEYNYIKTKTFQIDPDGSSDHATLTYPLGGDFSVSTKVSIELTDGFDTQNHEFEAKILSEHDIYHEDINYFDGLGRPLQNVAIKASPSGKNIIQHYVYDDAGRQKYSLLPITSTQTDLLDGNFADMSNNTGELFDFYANSSADFKNTNFPYAEVVYDNSPLDKVVEQSSPGEAWNIANGHTVRKEQSFIIGGIDTWSYTSVADGYGTYTRVPYTGKINVQTSYNEDNQSYSTYTDLKGNILQTNENGKITRYIYNGIGQLLYLIPPNLESITNFSISNHQVTNNQIYSYRYDNIDRLIEKTTPGAAMVQFVYDRAGNVVLMKDGTQISSGNWILMEYDKKGRLCITSEIHQLDSRIVLQQRYDNEPLRNTLCTRGISSTHGYVSSGFVLSEIIKSEANRTILSVNYYDDYDLDSDGKRDHANLYNLYNQVSETINRSAYGMLTAKKERVLDSDDFITSYVLYNNKGQVVKTYNFGVYKIAEEGGTAVRASIDESYDLVEYDYSGQVRKTVSVKKSTLTLNGVDYSDEVTEVHEFEYDHAGRLLTETMTVNDGTPTVLAQHEYNELGQLKEKNLNVEGGQALQSIDFKYNERGWLTNLNTADPSDAQENDLFGMELKYNDLLPNSPDGDYRAKYSGIITSTQWKHKNVITGQYESNGYAYTFDSYNQLDKAIYLNNNMGAYLSDPNNLYKVDVDYDLNGNITALNRMGYNAGQWLDGLSYTYNGNQITKVDDFWNNYTGLEGKEFTDGANFTTEYTYDKNGNMKTDANKGITNISYNYLNLAKEIVISGGYRMVKNTYTAGGKKLSSQSLQNGSTQEVTYYCGNLVYTSQSGIMPRISFLLHSQGRVVADETTGELTDYQYFLKDHLGNTRLTFAKADDGSAEIIQQADYYPFGLQMAKASLRSNDEQKYLYNGKELQSSFNLGLYDYGARMYDPALGRWHCPDPMEQYVSPYVYVGNNPVVMSDPTGMWGGTAIDGQTNGQYLNKASAFELMSSHFKEETKAEIKMQEMYHNAVQEADNTAWSVTLGKNEDETLFYGGNAIQRNSSGQKLRSIQFDENGNITKDESYNEQDEISIDNENSPLEYLALANDLTLGTAIGYNALSNDFKRHYIYETTKLKPFKNAGVKPGKTYQALKKIGKGGAKVLGKSANIIAVGSIAVDFGTGTANTATLVDATLLVGGVAATVFIGAAAAPVVVGVGIIYGVSCLFGFDDYLNETYDISDSINFIDSE